MYFQQTQIEIVEVVIYITEDKRCSRHVVYVVLNDPVLWADRPCRGAAFADSCCVHAGFADIHSAPAAGLPFLPTPGFWTCLARPKAASEPLAYLTRRVFTVDGVGCDTTSVGLSSSFDCTHSLVTTRALSGIAEYEVGVVLGIGGALKASNRCVFPSDAAAAGAIERGGAAGGEAQPAAAGEGVHTPVAV